jgi:hypothetical protein
MNQGYHMRLITHVIHRIAGVVSHLRISHAHLQESPMITSLPLNRHPTTNIIRDRHPNTTMSILRDRLPTTIMFRDYQALSTKTLTE